MPQRKHPRFGDRVRNTSAGERNPLREGYFVRTVTRRGRLNPGVWYECTDGVGNFWQQAPSSTEIIGPKARGEHE